MKKGFISPYPVAYSRTVEGQKILQIIKLNKKTQFENKISITKVLPSTSIGIPDTQKSVVVAKINCKMLNIVEKKMFFFF